MSAADEQKIVVTLSIRGDCGRPHPSFEDWQQCQTCGAKLETRLSDGRIIRPGQGALK